MWLKRNPTSAIESLQHIANTPFLGIIGRKKVNNLRKKSRHLSILRSKCNKIKFNVYNCVIKRKKVETQRN